MNITTTIIMQFLFGVDMILISIILFLIAIFLIKKVKEME